MLEDILVSTSSLHSCLYILHTKVFTRSLTSQDAAAAERSAAVERQLEEQVAKTQAEVQRCGGFTLPTYDCFHTALFYFAFPVVYLMGIVIQ